MLDKLAGSKFKGQELRYKMATKDTIKVTDALGVEQTFTDSEAITFLLMWQQNDGRRHMEGRFDDEGNIVSTWAWNEASAQSVEDQLSDEGLAMLGFFRNSYGTEYGRINQVFEKVWNVPMPRHKMYAPLTMLSDMLKDNQILDPQSGEMVSAGMTPKSLMSRSMTAVVEPDFRDAFQTFMTHTRQMEHFIAYAEFSRDALAIVNKREVRNAISANGGEAAANTLSKWVDYFAQGGVKNASTGGMMMQWLGNVLSRVSQSTLVGRISVIAMQSLQMGAAMYKMPTGAYLKRLALLNSGKLGWKDAVNSDYIQRRIKEMPPAIRDAVRGLSSGSPNRLKFIAAEAGRSITYSDAYFTAGTYAIVYDYQLSQAKKMKDIEDPEAHAHKMTESLVDEIAQPTRTGARSWIEVSQQGNPAFRALFNYVSDPRQKIALTIYELMRRDVKGIDKVKGIGKSVAVTWMVSGIMQAVIRAIMRDLRDNSDDEVFDERHWALDRLALQSFTGPIGGLPFIGGIIEESTYAATGQYMPQGGMLSGLGDAAKVVPRWMDGDFRYIEDTEKILAGGSLFSGTSAAGTSVMHLIRDTVRFMENTMDEDIAE